MYDWRGRIVDEPDNDIPQIRRHCAKCGAFLPVKPEEASRMVPSQWEYTYDGEGNTIGITVLEEEKETDYLWTCTRCKHQHDSDEMYG